MKPVYPSTRHSITFRMTVTVCTFLILFLAVLAALTFFYFKREFKETIATQQFTLLTVVARNIDQRLSSSLKVIVDVSRTITPEMVHDNDAAQRFLDNLPGTLSLFDNGLFLFSPEGKIIAESPFLPNRRGRDVSFREFYKKTISSGLPVISEPYHSTHTPGAPAVMFTTSVRDKGGKLIAILGGSNNLIDCPRVEGTHTYGVPLVSGNNNQVGVYLTNHATYGNVENTRIIKPDISGVAQGILEEAQAGIAHRTGMLTIDSPVLHDIPGQHGMYMQMGNLTVTSPSGANLTLSLVKLSSGNANLDTKGYSVTGANAYNIGGSIFELDVVGTGSINDALLTGTGRSVGYGIGITGKVSSIKADIVSDTAVGSHVYMTGANQSDVDITVNGRNSGQDGVLINATAATGIKIRPTLRESNTTTTASGCGIRLASASANVELFDPDVTDASTKMVYGLFNSIAGSTVKVRGSAKFTGASDTAVRATGVITEWPTEATLSGTNGAFTSQGNVSSSQEMVTTARSTSVTSVVVWQRTLPDASVTQVTVRLSGKLLNSAERRTLTLVSTFWRSGGVATQQGATTVISDHASAGFLGAYSLGVDGANGVALLANSGGVSTYDWVARSTVNVMS